MLARVVSYLRGFAAERKAVAATEFALLLPMVVLMYVGAGELSQAAMTSRKVELLSRSLADLASQQPTFVQATSTPAPGNAISQATLQTMMNASLAIMAPGSLATLKMTVSAVDLTNNSSGTCCKVLVRWSYTQAGTLRPCSTQLQIVDPKQAPSPTTISSAIVPSGIQLPGSQALLIADVFYTYQAPFSTRWIDLSSGMSRTSYMLPRTTGQVILHSPVTASGTQSGQICY